MSRRDGDTFVVAQEKPQQCDLCGVIAELRPYGPNGEAICFDCGMKNPEATQAAFAARVTGVSTVAVDLTSPDVPR